MSPMTNGYPPSPNHVCRAKARVGPFGIDHVLQYFLGSSPRQASLGPGPLKEGGRLSLGLSVSQPTVLNRSILPVLPIPIPDSYHRFSRPHRHLFPVPLPHRAHRIAHRFPESYAIASRAKEIADLLGVDPGPVSHVIEDPLLLESLGLCPSASPRCPGA